MSNAVAKPGEHIPLKIAIGSSLNPDFSFVMLRGLPPDFQVSAGFKTKDAWAVSLPDLRGLKLLPSTGFQGILQIEVVLVRGKDQPMEKRNVIVLVKNDDLADVAEPRKSPQPAATVPVAKSPSEGKPPVAESRIAALPPPPSPEKPTLPEQPSVEAPDLTPEDTALLLRGDRLLTTGDIAAARLLYTKVARKGFPDGAFKMAQTFDPQFLSSVQTAGLQPDLAQARQWYLRAAELGSPEAKQRLTRLAGAE